jgi:hypothetical protein
MSRAWYLQCDICGGPAAVVTEGAKEARLVARRYDGFKRIKMLGKYYDLCPNCTAELKLKAVA